jgi:cell division protein FtsZ
MVQTTEARSGIVSKLGVNAPAKIKVIGVGGGGCNAVRRIMETEQVPGVACIAVNTDVKSLETIGSAMVCQIGEGVTHGFGAGGDSQVGARAAEESRYSLKRAISGAELIFITAGMGGGTGTGAAPLVARVARETHALIVAVVTTPFSFEGHKRLDQAMAGISRLRPEVDNLIVVHNDRLLRLMTEDASMEEAFKTADGVVTQGIMSISKLVNVPGEINVDLADVKAVLHIPGTALMAIGIGEGSKCALEAAEQAIANPLLDITMDGAKGVLFNVEGGPDLKLGQVNEAGRRLSTCADRNARIFFGFMKPRADMEGQCRITLIATGIKTNVKKGLF